MTFRPLVDLSWLVIAATLLLCVVVYGLVWLPRADRRAWARRGLLVLLLLLTALRPGLGAASSVGRPSDLEVVLAVDRTASMSARDWNGEGARLEGVREDAAALVDALPSARFSILSFGRAVRTEMPSTRDVTLLTETMEQLGREDPFAGAGSAVDRPLPALDLLLRRMAEQHPERRRVLVLMSDGESTTGSPQRSYAALEPRIDGGAVLGYGTEAGGRIPIDEDEAGAGWVRDSGTDQVALSRIDEAALRGIASELGVDYLHRTGPGRMADVAAGWEQRFLDSPAAEEDRRVAHDLGWLLALALLAVGSFELRRQWQRLWQSRRELA